MPPPLRRRQPHTTLPVATAVQVREQAKLLLSDHRRPLAWMLLLNGLAAVAGLAGPQLLGDMVQSVTDGTTTEHIDKLALILAAALLAQTVLTWLARRSAFVLAENVFAVLRERFLEKVLSLPLSTVERAGTGDLVTRSTGDIEALARTVRFAVPEVLVASVTVLLTVVAGFLTSPLMALPLLCGAPVIWAGTKWYLRRAPEGYLAERECYAAFNGSLAETVDGARTVEALGLGDRRIRRLEEDLEDAFAAERYTLRLRTVFFPAMELAYAIPISLCLVWGGWLVSAGQREPRPGHGGHAVRRAAGRPGRPAGVLAGRGPGRRHRAGPDPRRRAGPAGPRAGRRRSRTTSTSRCRTCASPTARAATCCTASTSTCAPASGSPWSGRPAPASRRWAGCWPGCTRRGPAR